MVSCKASKSSASQDRRGMPFGTNAIPYPVKLPLMAAEVMKPMVVCRGKLQFLVDQPCDMQHSA